MKLSKIVRDKNHLLKLIEDEISLHGLECDLNHLNVSRVKDMEGMFSHSKFNGDISNWDVSKVTDMNWMFFSSQFKGDLTDWLPYKLENKLDMFKDCTAPKPYWYIAENTKKAIETYQLNNKLECQLSDINKIVKKIKI